MPFDSNAYSREWHRRNPGKAGEYYRRKNPGATTLEALKAEASARTEKACTKCGQIKPLEEYPKAKQRRDGRDSHCLECMKLRTAKSHLAKKLERAALNPKEILPDGFIRCNRCGVIKPADVFARNSRICRQCDCDYAKAAYHRDPKKSKDYHRQWCKDHPEEIKKLRRAAYHRANPGGKTIAQVMADKEAKALRAEKPCKKCGIIQPIESFGLSKKTADGRQYQCLACFAERGRRRYASNPKILEKSKKWSKEHPEATRHIAQIRRARKRGIPGSHTLKQWQDLCAKFKHRCVCCGKSGKLTRDHIIPISNPNSSHDISNIQPLCYSCNSSKNNRFSVDYRKTPFVRAGQELLFG